MPQTATCSCGYVMTFEDEEEFYGLLRRHILPLEKDRHHLVARSVPVKGRPVAATAQPASAASPARR